MLFEPNSRIEKIDSGIRFYEQDIIFSDYVFEGDVEVNLHLDYLHPGFGIVIAEKYKGGPRNSEKAHLFKLGRYVFQVIEKTLLAQAVRKENSCVLAPDIQHENINLVFRIEGRNMKLLLRTKEGSTERTDNEELGTYKFPKDLGEYYIGFYSNYGNVIRSAKYIQGVPENWVTSIHNTNGGRISFIKDGFRFEKCEHDAELEQDNIVLEAGTYYVKFDTEEVNERFDIDCYIFPSDIKKYLDKNLEDEVKNLLQDGKFTLKEKTSVDMKFNGTDGIVKNVCIIDDPESSFVETFDEPVTIDGSYIRIDLSNVSKIDWDGVITSVPEWEDFTRPCPYAIVETMQKKLIMEDLGVHLGDSCRYVFDAGTKKIAVFNSEEQVGSYTVPFIQEDQNKITIFHNMNARITRLIITDRQGKEIDVIHQKTFKAYVTNEISGPILVRTAEGEPLDLSPSYREVVEQQPVIEFFKKDYEIALKSRPVDEDIRVYGIPFGATIKRKETEIKEYATDYVEIAARSYTIKDRVVTVDPAIREQYQGIAVQYLSAEDYSYYFTNYEREYFEDGERIVLDKPIADVSGGVLVYGCLEKPDLDYLYRVPSEMMANSIDICCRLYDIIPETSMEITTSEVKLSDDLRKRYPYIIVDYLKANSYAINYRPDLVQYEVDISMESSIAELGYEMNEDGSMDDRIRTTIVPDHSKYIILQRKAGEFA